MNNVTSPVQSAGDIYSIRCSLQHLNPATVQACKDFVGWLIWSKRLEKQGQNRATVINMINAKIKRLEKKMEELRNG